MRRTPSRIRHGCATGSCLIAAHGGALLNGFGCIGGERNSSNRGEFARSHYVRYGAAEADILFDLLGVRHLHRIHVVKGPERVTPISIETYTSVDDGEFVRNAAVPLRNPTTESVIDMHQVEARYVKLRVIWPRAGGT